MKVAGQVGEFVGSAEVEGITLKSVELLVATNSLQLSPNELGSGLLLTTLLQRLGERTRFTSRGIRQVGPGEVLIDGTVTCGRVAEPLSFPARLERLASGKMKLSGTVTKSGWLAAQAGLSTGTAVRGNVQFALLFASPRR